MHIFSIIFYSFYTDGHMVIKRQIDIFVSIFQFPQILAKSELRGPSDKLFFKIILFEKLLHPSNFIHRKRCAKVIAKKNVMEKLPR